MTEKETLGSPELNCSGENNQMAAGQSVHSETPLPEPFEAGHTAIRTWNVRHRKLPDSGGTSRQNYVSSTKYTPLNFLLKNLYEQFHRPENFFFLLIAVLACIPAISPVPWITSVAPLLFVLAVNGKLASNCRAPMLCQQALNPFPSFYRIRHQGGCGRLLSSSDGCRSELASHSTPQPWWRMGRH